MDGDGDEFLNSLLEIKKEYTAARESLHVLSDSTTVKDAEYDLSCAVLGDEVLRFKSRIARWLTICNDIYRRAEIALLVAKLDHLAAAIQDMRLTINSHVQANAPPEQHGAEDSEAI
ncbi:hypothetical protein Rs2_06046 [Raphanus sativus]|nr:hypothetical protein Rs2_06046 [Raphanus sativus]